MALIAKKGNFELQPEGTHHAVCYGVVDLGIQVNTRWNNASPKIMILWELVNEFNEFNGEQKRITISNEYTLSLGSKANLRADLESWRGKAFTAEELEGYNITNVIGRNCLLQIIHETAANGNTYANIKSVMGLMNGMTTVESENEHICFDFDENGDQESIQALPEWIQNKIKASSTYIELFGQEQPVLAKRNVQQDAKSNKPQQTMAKREVARPSNATTKPVTTQPTTDVF